MMYRVLIADDEPHMLKFIEFTLRKGDFEILKANMAINNLQNVKIFNFFPFCIF